MAKTTNPNSIVIVDDELHNMIWMVDYLELKGFKTILSSDAKDAIAILDKEIYRVVIVDLNIPVLDPLAQ